MFEQRVFRVIASAIGRSLGASSEVVVTGEGFRVPAVMAAAARCLGSGGRVVKMSLQGWGAAFELRKTSKYLIVDLHSDVDDLVVSAMRDTRELLNIQHMRRARAGAFGIRTPLTREGFVDFARLRVDIAAAKALHGHLGNDDAVRRWLRDQLGAVWDSHRVSGPRPALRVHGLVVGIPLLLDSMELTLPGIHMDPRSRWLDDEVRVLLSPSKTCVDVQDGLESMLKGTPLMERAILRAAVWPSQEVSNALDRADRTSGRGFSFSAPPRDENRRDWQIIVERRAVSVLEAFG